VKLVAHALPGWSLATGEPINTGGVTKLVPALPRYAQQAQHVQPVLCIADTDGECPVKLLANWLPRNSGGKLLLRLAVVEGESWVLSDRAGAAEFFGVAPKAVPAQPDSLVDPKREVLRLARSSRVRVLRQEVVSAENPNKPGVGYNIHISRFVAEKWDVRRAAEESPSLRRAVLRLSELAERSS
jgi:hypothetical protein